MKIRCRLLDREDTERVVDVDDADVAPDVYANENLKESPVGAVAFVQSFVDGAWETWEVEVFVSGPGGRGFITMPTTEAEARAEIAAARGAAS